MKKAFKAMLIKGNYNEDVRFLIFVLAIDETIEIKIELLFF